LQAEAHPGHNIIGVLLGPESSTQKRLHEVWSILGNLMILFCRNIPESSLFVKLLASFTHGRKLELSFEYMGLRKSMEKRYILLR